MKKTALPLFLAIFVLGSSVQAQQPDKRSMNGLIFDILSNMPARDSAAVKDVMADVSIFLKKSGLPGMIELLSAPGQGNNSRLEYAISGFSSFVARNNNEELRKTCVAAYCQALEKLTNNDNKAFLIDQLGTIGKDEAVPCLRQYLTYDALADPASRALVKINTALAGNALLEALSNAGGSARLSLLQALGLTCNHAALAAVHALAAGSDKDLRRLALAALAAIADPSSAKVLAAAARDAQFTYESTRATASYLSYAQNLSHYGYRPLAEKIARELLSTCSHENQSVARTAALVLLAGIHANNNISLLLRAAGDKQLQYRAAALRLAIKYSTPSNTVQWIRKYKSSDPGLQAAIIQMLGKSHALEALPIVTEALRSNHKELRLAAIVSAAELAQDKVLNRLLAVVKKGDSEEIAAVKNTVLVMKDRNIAGRIAGTMASMPPVAKAALIEILSEKAAHNQLSLIYSLLKSRDSTVNKAAFAALKNIVTEQDIPMLFTILKGLSNGFAIRATQDALLAAIRHASNKPATARMVFRQMETAEPAEKKFFYRILAASGGAEGLQLLSAGCKSEDEQTRNEALEALLIWPDETAASILYQIASDSANSKRAPAAFRGYLTSVSGAAYRPEQKLLLLRAAMDIAKAPAKRLAVLTEAGKINTFSALMLVGKYLDDPALQQGVASIIMNMVLSGKDYYGSAVSALLNRAIQAIKGAEREYQKEAIRRVLLEMPVAEGYLPLFNGIDLAGWNGWVKPAEADSKASPAGHDSANEATRKDWNTANGELLTDGKNTSLYTAKKYNNFELLADWKMEDKGGEAGIRLPGNATVWLHPTHRADGIQAWSSIHIVLTGDSLTVYQDGLLITDTVIHRAKGNVLTALPEGDVIALYEEGAHIAFRDIYLRETGPRHAFELSEAEKKEGFHMLFDGSNLDNWTGNKINYVIEDGNMVIHPPTVKGANSGGNIYTKEEYGDFDFRFEFLLTTGANNGVGVRTPAQGDAAYQGMELQILDNDAEIYKTLHDYQYHGSVYGVIPAKRGYLKPVGEWNYEELIIKGTAVKVVLNGTVILDADIAAAADNGTPDHLKHPGLKQKKGFISFLGHGSVVYFRNIRVKEL